MVKNINEISINGNNPRRISAFMQKVLMRSVLSFPEMLTLRPLVVNADGVVLGGNQRLTVLQIIVTMPKERIEKLLMESSSYRNASQEDKDKLVSSWLEWQKDPKVEVRDASNLSDDEQMEFLVKDNMHYGEDDPEILDTLVDHDMLEEYTGVMLPQDNDEVVNADADTDGKADRPMMFSTGSIAIPVSTDEATAFNTAYDDYISRYGRYDGFVTFLLTGQDPNTVTEQ